MKYGYAFLISLITLLMISAFVAADRLPNQTPENQVFTIDTVIDATGLIDAATDMTWVITSPGAIETGSLASHGVNVVDGVSFNSLYYPAGKVIADVVYKDSVLTNGGKLAENKNLGFDSKNKALGLYNIEAQKVLTYASTEGAHMVGEEQYTLDVAAEAKNSTDNIRCVFAAASTAWLPPFCNIVSAKSSLVNVNSAQISSKGQIRAVAKTDSIPADLHYQIAVTPDANSGSGFAEGTVKTTFAGSVMEGRDSGMYLTQDGANYLNNNYNVNTALTTNQRRNTNTYKAGDPVPWDFLNANADYLYTNETTFATSAENTWKDSTSATGGIKNFQKAFAYQSGFFI